MLVVEPKMFEIPSNQDTLLVTMPWHWLMYPSYQMGVINTLINQTGRKSSTHNAHLSYCEFLIREKKINNFHDYNYWANASSIAAWAFLTPDFKGSFIKTKVALREVCSDPIRLRQLKKIQKSTHAFSQRLTNEIVDAKPGIVVFLAGYDQIAPALSLSQQIKKLDSSIKILFIDHLSEGLMGSTLISAFPWVDCVIHGEMESIISEVIEELLQGGAMTPRWGISFRDSCHEPFIGGAQLNVAKKEDWVIPNYDDYFRQLDTTSVGEALRPKVWIPFESSRGCWWGMKKPCHFCALGRDMTYRKKQSRQVIDEIRLLAKKYKHPRMYAVDHVMDFEHQTEFLEGLKVESLDFDIYYQVKANLGPSELLRMKQAGINTIQPGIESLSTPILELMNKGITAIQNLRTLKFATWFGIEVQWNLICGFPGEPVEDYRRMVEIVKSIPHFPPPQMNKFELLRTSFCFEQRDKFGLEITGVPLTYKMCFSLQRSKLLDFATVFEFRYLDGRNPKIYSRSLKREIDKWRKIYQKSKNSLIFHRVGDCITIVDRRSALSPSLYKFGPHESRIYAHCLDVTSLETITRDPILNRAGFAITDIEEFCDLLVAARLAFREGDQLLALALPARKAGIEQEWDELRQLLT